MLFSLASNAALKKMAMRSRDVSGRDGVSRCGYQTKFQSVRCFCIISFVLELSLAYSNFFWWFFTTKKI